MIPLKVDFVADLVCPFCWIGWRRLGAALDGVMEGLGASEIVWRPYQLDPTVPAGGLDRAAYMAGKFGDASRVDAMHARIDQMAAEDGLEFRWGAISRRPNTAAAHRLMLWAQGEWKMALAAEALMAGYFRDGRDIGDFGVLAEIAGEVGMDAALVAEKLARGDDVGLVDEAQAMAARSGVQGVPFFVFGGRVAVSGAQGVEVLRGAIARAGA